MKYPAVFVLAWGAFLVYPWLRPALPEPHALADDFQAVSRAELAVTEGRVGEEGGDLTTDSPAARGVARAAGARAARLVFTYHGPTRQESKLASGETVHQIGLKLRAKNACNLLYVMWKLDGPERLAVSVKRNPGQSTSRDCGARGYASIKPTFAEKRARFPSGKDGKPHTLEAELSKPDADHYELVARADGKVVWRGRIEAELLDDVDGPAGFRTDNGVFTFRFFTLGP